MYFSESRIRISLRNRKTYFRAVNSKHFTHSDYYRPHLVFLVCSKYIFEIVNPVSLSIFNVNILFVVHFLSVANTKTAYTTISKNKRSLNNRQLKKKHSTFTRKHLSFAKNIYCWLKSLKMWSYAWSFKLEQYYSK